MKEKVKIWSRRRLLGAFLAFLGLSAVATAQNGTRKANCANELQVITRTVDQMDSIGGTVIPIKFDVTSATGNPDLIGDKVYIVAETNGSLTTLDQTNCAGIGQNLKLVGTGTTATIVQDEVTVANVNYTGTTDPDVLGNVVATIPDNGIVRVRVNREAGADISTPFKLGVFIGDVAGANATQCFSDVYWVSIQVINNIYATLNLHQTNQVAKEYICSGTQTITNIGFDLCGIPQSAEDATLHYAMTFDNTGVAGMSLNDGVNTALSGTGLYTLGIGPNEGAYSLRIGQQTLTNTSGAVASSVTYRFLEGLDKFYLTYTDGTRTVNVPIIFITNEANCTGNPITDPASQYTADQMSHGFTVHVAPAFTVTPLAYETADLRTAGDVTTAITTFCQGTVAYLDANTTVTTGANSVITTLGYTWTVADNLATDANIEQPNSKELVRAGDDTYTFTVTAQWDDAQTDDGVASGNWANVAGIEGGVGCKITSAGLVIDVTAAPILLVATDKVVQNEGGVEVEVWNTTNVITANTYCPGQTVYINTLDAGTPVLDGTNRADAIMVGNYIKHNGAEIKWTIDVPNNMGAYSTWRTTPVAGTGNIAVTDPDANPDVTHYLDNESVTPTGIITYTLENAGTTSNTCKLVKSDGSSLNLVDPKDGKVQIKYPVSPRPTFNLSAN